MNGAFGFGAVSNGITETGFNYFLLIFYSQVIGLDARLVSLAITLSLILDAFTDPVVGYWSDNLRSRWGRRHPFMYWSAVPLAVGLFVGGHTGPMVVRRAPARLLRRVIAVAGLGLAGYLGFTAYS